ncbi:MAG: hypothetical protein K0S68_957 [Candidatus Saccharibacteria bacterium]|nr:hypothetical protein [Candidatus Saccharibacteria bacterium]
MVNNLAVVAGLPAVMNIMQQPTPVLVTEDRMALWDMATASGRYGSVHEWTAQAGEHRRAAATANGDGYEG